MSTVESPAARIASNSDGSARRARRVARFLGPWLLYVLIALGILWPYRSNKFRGAGDLAVVMALVADAEYALKEHQFPIRVAPHLHDGLRYPLYQYYGNFPYTLTGVLAAGLRMGPYAAWKIVMLSSLVLAGFFTMRLALLVTRHYTASALAGAVFLTAPYVWTDINSRGAFSETIGFNLLPAAIYFTLRCFESRRLRNIPLCATTWALIALSHNITYFYGVVFMALFLLPRIRMRGLVAGLGRLALAGMLHALLILWYIVPQLKTLPLIGVGASISTSSPIVYADLTPWQILLAPVLTNTLRGATSPGLGLQVGWPILGGVTIATIGLIVRWRRIGAPMRLTTITLLIIFAVALFLAWTPFDVWRFLPKVFWFAQFPYRLLIFVVMFGSLLAGCGLAAFLRRRESWPKLTTVVLALLGLSVSSYLPRPAGLASGFVKAIEKTPGVVSVDDYVPSPPAVAATSYTNLDPLIDTWDARSKVTDSGTGGSAGIQTVVLPRERVRVHASVKCEYNAHEPVLLELPVLYYPGLLDVRDGARPIEYGNAGHFLAVPLQPGAHHLSVRFVGVTWANVLGWVGWGGIAAMGVAGILIHLRRRQSSKAQINWWAAAGRSAFGPRSALLGFGAMAACAIIPAARPWKLLSDPGPRLTVSSSSKYEDAFPEFAFDGEPQTAWQADNSGPATLSVRFSRAATLHALVLEPRLTGLYEGYSRVGVVLSLGGKRVYAGTFDFPRAAHEPTEVVEFPRTKADAMELNFSEPILEARDGTRVPSDMVRPGYSEIHIQWDR